MKSVSPKGAPPTTTSPRQRPARRGSYVTLPAEELVAHCQQGDPVAFDALVSRYQRSIYKLAYQFAGNYDDAHEITSETFLRIYRAIHTLQSADSLPGWIGRIAANVHSDMRRSARRHRAVSLDTLDEPIAGAAGDCDYAGPASPYALAEESDRSRILDDAIASLPYYDRAVVTLFHRQGQNYEEIADIMRMPLGTVKSRLHRARRALRERLVPEMSAFAG